MPGVALINVIYLTYLLLTSYLLLISLTSVITSRPFTVKLWTLYMLPCLAVDPISKRLEANTNCLHSVADKMNGLPPKVSDAVTSALSAPLTSCCDSLNSLVNNVASQVQQLVSCVDSLKGSFTSNANTNNSTGAVSPTPADASPSGSTQSRAISWSIHSEVATRHRTPYLRTKLWSFL